MELNYIHGAKITKEIKTGKAIHEELEDQVNVPIILMPKSYGDFMYKVLYTSTMALEALVKNKIAREIQVYGQVNRFKFVGKMDQLEINKNNEVVVWEDKTKASDNLPSDPQFLTHKAQVMLYRKMMEEIRKKIYTIETFKKGYGISTLKITAEFARQLEAMSVEQSMHSLDSIAARYFECMQNLPAISDTLHIRYINQFTGKEIKVYKVTYDEKEMEGMLEFVLKYWNGERESLPVPEEEKWKCNWCAFFGKECKVWWPQKKL